MTTSLRFGSTAAGLLAGVASLALVAQGERAGAAAPVSQPLDLAVVKPVADCSVLTATDVSGAVGATTRVTAAATGGSAAAPYCAVQVTVDDYAKFELRLPTTAWTQRLLFGGGPGAQTAGGMDLSQFATVSWQDLGRRPNEDVFRDRPADHVNAGYRGMHLQVLATKALIGRFYGQGPRFSYYNACSNPGREGMIEVERFPQDFDGTAAGCPPINTTFNNGMWHAWNVMANTGADGQAILTADKLPILHKAVLDACDAADGATDAIISEPFACRVPFEKVECKPSDAPAGCLTPAQVRVARELYRGPHDDKGAKLTPIGVLPGSELAWTATIVPSDAPFGGPKEARTATEKAIRSHYSLPALPADWTLDKLRFDRATFDATTRLNYLHDGTDTDLSGYAKAGHKLILWMSLGDTNVLPAQAILFYETLRLRMGAKATDQFVRFYTLPGVYHCGGGEGPVIGDVLKPLMLWVERGIAPEALEGVHRPRRPGGPGQGAGASMPAIAPDLTRPIYPYPYTAKYVGKGDVRLASSFVKGPARPAPASLADWPGASFYQPGSKRWCTAGATGLQCTRTP